MVSHWACGPGSHKKASWASHEEQATEQYSDAYGHSIFNTSKALTNTEIGTNSWIIAVTELTMYFGKDCGAFELGAKKNWVLRFQKAVLWELGRQAYWEQCTWCKPRMWSFR